MKGFRWIIILFAMLVMAKGHADRALISYAFDLLKRQLSISDQQFGVLLAVYGVGFVVAAFFGGLLVDKIGGRWMVGIFAILWGLVAFLHEWARDYSPLLLVRFLMGLTAAPQAVAVVRCVANWSPKTSRMRYVSVILLGVPLGASLAALFISRLVVNIGWRESYLVLGAISLVLGIIWLFIANDYPRRSRFVGDEELALIYGERQIERGKSGRLLRQEEKKRMKQRGSIMYLLWHNRSLLVNYYSGFVLGYILFFGMMWLPGYLEQTYKLEIIKTGNFLLIPWLVALLFIGVAGFLSDWLYHRTKHYLHSRSTLVWVCLVFAFASFYLLSFGFTGFWTIVLISLGIGFALATYPTLLTLNIDLARDRVGTAVGIWFACSAVGGVLASLLTGYLASIFQGFGFAFLLLSVFTVTAVFAVALFQRPDEDIIETYEDV